MFLKLLSVKIYALWGEVTIECLSLQKGTATPNQVVDCSEIRLVRLPFDYFQFASTLIVSCIRDSQNIFCCQQNGEYTCLKFHNATMHNRACCNLTCCNK